METDRSLRALDRWVIRGSVIVAIALIAAAIVRPEQTGAFVSALGGMATLVVLYFIFGRSNGGAGGRVR
jgi:hypothetical protein